MLLGYNLVATDTRKWLLGDNLEYAPSNPCNKYKNIYEINFLPDNFLLPRGKKDFYETLDGFFLVSEKVKEFCDYYQYKNLEFVPLPNSNYYWFKSENILKYDIKTRGTRFLNHSEECNGYLEIVGATPVCLIDKKPIGDNFFRTDVFFGGKNGKSPLLCIGIETFSKIKDYTLSGLHFQKILDKYDKIPDMSVHL